MACGAVIGNGRAIGLRVETVRLPKSNRSAQRAMGGWPTPGSGYGPSEVDFSDHRCFDG
jgi:hypothetical protein